MSERYQRVKYLTLVDGLKNIILVLIKISLGYLGQSHALIADGVHSFADVLTDVLVLFAAKYGVNRPADTERTYGYGRVETAANLGLALILMLTAIAIIYDSGQRLWSHAVLEVPATFILWTALLAVVANEIIYRYMLTAGRRIKSDLLITNALHSRSDALTSLVVLIGVVGSLLGFPFLDPLAAVAVGFFIIKMAINIAKNSLTELIDTGLDQITIKQIKQIIFDVPGVLALHELRTRRMAGRALVEAHIIVNPYISVSEGHHIGERVIAALKQKIAVIEQVIIHIDAENDEAYSSTSQLPLREELMPLLEKYWLGLPGFDQYRSIRLNYLAGMIDVEIELPHTLLSSQAKQSLILQYQHAIHSLVYVGTVKLLF